jgi:DNA-directed RNA polymerase subunit alpha
VTIANPEHVICTLTEAKANLNMEVTVQRGRGYLPVESREKERLEIGTLAIDALFSPVVTVGMKVENVRVEEVTNYERVTLNVETDGTLTPAAAVAAATQILLEHINFIGSNESLSQAAEAATAAPKPAKKSKAKVAKE